MDQYLNKTQKERDNVYVKKDIHYLYPSDQDMADLGCLINLPDSNIQKEMYIQEEKIIQDTLMIKIQELEKHNIIPVPSSQIVNLLQIIWENFQSNTNKNSLFQVKQVIVGCHFEEQWDLLIRQLDLKSKDFRIQCLRGVLHDINEQKQEFQEITNQWQKSTLFLRGFIPVYQKSQNIDQQISLQIQKQTYEIFNFQLSNIKRNLAKIFNDKLTELQEIESKQTQVQQQQQSTSQQQQLTITEQQQQQINSSNTLNLSPQSKPSQELNTLLQPSIQISSITQNKNQPSVTISSVEQSPQTNIIKVTDISFNDLNIEKDTSHKNSTDMQNQTFGKLENSMIIEEDGGDKKIQEQEQENEENNPLIKRVGSLTLNNQQNELNTEKIQSQQVPQIQISTPQNQAHTIQNSYVTNRFSIQNKSSKEMSTKTPIRMSSPSLAQSQTKRNSISSGRNSITSSQSLQNTYSPQTFRSNQDLIGLYDIMNRTKKSVKKEIKIKMVKMLDDLTKEKLNIEQELELIEVQINEIMIKVLKKRAEMEIQELVDSKILTILRTELSKIFQNKDLDFWLKFNRVKERTRTEWILKIDKFLKDNFNFGKDSAHSLEIRQKAEDTIRKEVKSFIKVKMGDIISDFIEEIQNNDKIQQGKEDTLSIYKKYKEFVMEVQRGSNSEENDPDAIILKEEEYKQILQDLTYLLQNHKNKLKFKYNQIKISIEKSVMKRRNTFFSLNPYLKLNHLTIALFLICTILYLRDSITLENSIGLILFSHVLYTFIKK